MRIYGAYTNGTTVEPFIRKDLLKRGRFYPHQTELIVEPKNILLETLEIMTLLVVGGDCITWDDRR